MSGIKVKLPKGTKVGDDGKIIPAERRPKDASQAMAWKKSKKQKPVSRAEARRLDMFKRGK
jgi:hypothetical protein